MLVLTFLNTSLVQICILIRIRKKCQDDAILSLSELSLHNYTLTECQQASPLTLTPSFISSPIEYVRVSLKFLYSISFTQVQISHRLMVHCMHTVSLSFRSLSLSRSEQYISLHLYVYDISIYLINVSLHCLYISLSFGTIYLTIHAHYISISHIN